MLAGRFKLVLHVGGNGLPSEQINCCLVNKYGNINFMPMRSTSAASSDVDNKCPQICTLHLLMYIAGMMAFLPRLSLI